MRRLGPLAVLVALLLAACGGSSHNACTTAANGHGTLGACAPKQALKLTAPRLGFTNGPTYPDRSNNNPCYCGATIRAQGHVGLIVKANQGTGFIDSTAGPMIQSARAAGLAVGEYDFDQTYTVAEAKVFVARLHAAGIYPHTRNTFPAYFDVEFGNFNYAGLLAQIAYVRAQGYRVGVYTGQWYWGPHAGCRWPAGVTAWLSGYPNAPVPCGTTGYNSHQFTSTPIDLSVYLGSRAQFAAFVNATPRPRPLPVCYSHREAKAQCSAAKARIASDNRAAGASQRAFAARGCLILDQRVRWFRAALAAHPRVRTAGRRNALAASRTAYRVRSCTTFQVRARYFQAAAKAVEAAN